MDHAVDVAVEADEQAELGLVLDLALDLGANRVTLDERLPRVLQRLLEAEEMRRLEASTSSTCTSTSWLVEMILPGWTFFLVHDISETWISPSMPGSSSTNAP